MSPAWWWNVEEAQTELKATSEKQDPTSLKGTSCITTKMQMLLLQSRLLVTTGAALSTRYDHPSDTWLYSSVLYYMFIGPQTGGSCCCLNAAINSLFLHVYFQCWLCCFYILSTEVFLRDLARRINAAFLCLSSMYMWIYHLFTC